MKILNEIQQKLKAPKGQYNNFGKYKYRSCEDILEAVKPMLGDATLMLTDSIELIGDRYYIKATVKISDGDESAECVAYAREPQNKKGMDESQITGTASSYARKYALNGLFCIDDAKETEVDEQNKTKAETQEIELTPEQMDFIDKVAILLEENLDGDSIDRPRLRAWFIDTTIRTGKETPTEDEKVGTLVTYLLNKEATLNLLKEEKNV